MSIMELLGLWGIAIAVSVIGGIILGKMVGKGKGKSKTIGYALSLAIAISATVVAMKVDVVENTTQDVWVLILFGWLTLFNTYFFSSGGKGDNIGTAGIVMLAVIVGVSALILIPSDGGTWASIQKFIPSIAIVAGGAVILKLGGGKGFAIALVFAVVVGIVSYYVGGVATSAATIVSFASLGFIGGKKGMERKKCLTSGGYWNGKKGICQKLE